MKRIGLLLLVFLLSDARPQAISSSHPFSEELVLKFADFLFDQKEYQRAILEYNRYLFLGGRNQNAVIFKTGRCYLAAKDFNKALEVFDRLSRSFPTDSLGLKAQLYKVLAYFNLGEYQKSLNLADQLLDQSGAYPYYRTRIFQLQTADHLALHEWTLAENSLSQISLDTCCAKIGLAYSGLTEKGKHMRFHKPLCAAMLSGMIPGLGKIYAGRATDGVFSLMLVSLCAWQSYDGFSKSDIHSRKGWLWGSLGGIFYFGNIYGSYIAVKINNQELRNEFLCQLQVLLNNDFHF